MSHVKRAVRQKDLCTLSSHMKVKEISCGADACVPSCSSVCHRTEEQGSSSQKVKRLKTIKERNRIRGQSTYRSKHIYQHSKRACKEKCYRGHDCQCSRSLTCSKREKPVAKPFHPEKPSIITQGRLTSIRGLFSHEIRSVDIERLVRVKERQKRQVTAEKSPCQSPPSVLSEKVDDDICTFVEETQMLKTSEQTDHAQTILEAVDKINGKCIDKTTESESPPCQKRSETISGSETIHKTSSRSLQAPQTNQNDHTSPIIQNPPRLHDRVQIRQTTNAKGKLHSNPKDVLQSDSTPAISDQRAMVADESLSRKPKPSPDMEAVGRVAARLCHSLLSFPKQRHRPLLTECKEILFQCLQERHGSQLEHNLQTLRSFNSADEHRSPPFKKQAWPSSAQSSEDTCTDLNPKTGYDVDHTGNVEFQAGKDSQEHLEGQDFETNAERKAQCRKRRTHYWGTYTPQDFLQKLQQPNTDTLSKKNMCSETVESLDFSQAKMHTTSPSTSHHPVFTRPQIPKPPSYNWPDLTSDSIFLPPRKQLISGETKPRQITLLLERYKHDPDLSFLWSNTIQKIHTEREVRDWSPLQPFKSVTDRPLGASSSSSAFFSSEGFRYEPFYRFPHPPIAVNSLERSGKSHHSQSNVKLRGLSSADLYSSNLPYWP